MTYIMSGLKHFLQKSGLSIGKTDTVQKLLEQLQWVNNVDSVSPSSRNAGSGGEKQCTSVKTNRVTSEEPICYQCKEPGHTARKCPKVKCFRCSLEGHLKLDCKANIGFKNEQKGRGSTGGTNLMRMVDKKSLFRKTVELSGKQYEAHIDSGADRSTVWEKFKGQMEKVKSCNFLLQGFGKSDKVKVKELVTARLVVDGIELDVSLAVVPDWAQDVPVILGKDIIKRDDDQEER